MENLVVNMSVWGVVFVLLTTIRIAFRATITTSISRLSVISGLFYEKIHVFLQQAYKPLILSVLSAFVLFVCYKITGDRYLSMWAGAVMGGVTSIGVGALLKPGLASFSIDTASYSQRTHKSVQLLLDEKNINNAGTLFVGLLSLLLVLINYQSTFNWNSYAVLSLLASFASGASGLLLCMHAYEFATTHYILTQHKSPTTSRAVSGKILNDERFDTLLGTLAGAMLLGTTLCNISMFQNFWLLASPVLLPLALTISGVSISSLAATLGRFNGWKKDPVAYLSEKMVSAVIMIISAFFITQHLLPSYWVCNGIEYTAMQVFYAAQAGIIGGLLTNKVAQGYKTFHRKYFSYLARKSFRVTMMDSVFHFTISTLSALLPIFLISIPMLFSYQLVGLYGIVIALVAMLANLSTQLTTGK